ncbi:hypothetical protein ES703_84842 [subsurface metagenome]
MKNVLLSLLIFLVLLWSFDTVSAKDKGKGQGKKTGQLTEHPPGWKQGKKQGWKTELPPGWEKWDDAKRQQWGHGLNRAKDAVRKHAEARLNAALRALEMAARKGVPLHHAEETTKAGLDRGLGPFDFEPLGKFVVERVREGTKGRNLSRAIHEEINRRRQERERLRQKMKENIRHRQEERKKLRKKMKEKTEPEKLQKERSLGKGTEEQEKGRGKHGRPHPKEERGKGKTKGMKEEKRDGGREALRRSW